MKNYGNLLKKERESRNISQDYLSKNIGISQAQISYYEHNINIPQSNGISSWIRINSSAFGLPFTMGGCSISHNRILSAQS